MESCERATSDFFSAMFLSKGYWYSLFDLYDTSFYLSHMFGVSIEELLDAFETIGFVKKVASQNYLSTIIGTHGPKGFHVCQKTNLIEPWNLARGIRVISSAACEEALRSVPFREKKQNLVF